MPDAGSRLGYIFVVIQIDLFLLEGSDKSFSIPFSQGRPLRAMDFVYSQTKSGHPDVKYWKIERLSNSIIHNSYNKPFFYF